MVDRGKEVEVECAQWIQCGERMYGKREKENAKTELLKEKLVWYKARINNRIERHCVYLVQTQA